MCVCPRGLGRALQDLDAVRGEDGVEDLGVLAVAVAEQIADVCGALAEVGEEVAGELGGPGSGGVGGDAENAHGAGADLHGVEDVQPSQGHGVDVEDVGGEQSGCLGA